MQKHIFYILTGFYIVLLFFWISITYSSFYKDIQIKLDKVINKNIYIENDKLNNAIVSYSSNFNISNYKIDSSCVYNDKFLYSIDDKYYFSFSVKKDCINKRFYLKDTLWNRIYNTYFELKLLSNFDVYDLYLNYETDKLFQISSKLSLLKDNYSIIVASNQDLPVFTPNNLKKNHIFSEINYNKEIIDKIIAWRDKKYTIPVAWYDLPDWKNKSKLPNSARPYRANYTNAVHEWWDIDTPFLQEVISIDDWIIIRVVNNFEFEDLKFIKKWKNLTDFDKINNLDILRWNQVWLKTMKWDVIFYWHLDKIYDDINVWTLIKKWVWLGTVWISWVPDKAYKDYHLHFELRKNDYNKNPNIYDYMSRDWYFKWEKSDYIIKNQYKIFE